jgi:hypothetical protein
MAAQATRPKVAAMLASVTLLGFIASGLISLADLTGRERVNPDLRGRGLCCKWGGEAKEAKFWPLLSLLQPGS